ncbi:MAG: hypothetical protein VXX30_00105, partial [Planctomycetota bacterium]|nr:hypothetical protein [Planctomycetota bacterium]
MACGTDPCSETTITVCPDGSCDFTDIQSAIDASSFEAIEIGAGTYALSAPLTIGERPGLTLRGAVGEDGTLLTVLDGQGRHRLFETDAPGTTYETAATFEGLILRNGSAEAGGVVRIENDFLAFTDCVLEGNVADEGGAVCQAGGRMTFVGCRFAGNVAQDQGGAIYLLDGTGSFTNCMFDANAAADGGAIYATEGELTCSGGGFTSNQASDDGGAIFARSTQLSMMLDGVSLQENTAGDEGGAIHCGSNHDLTGCTFTGNGAASEGGAIVLTRTALGRIESTSFLSNTAQRGGAIASRQCDPELVDCLVSGNFAGLEGGGLRFEGGAPILVGCTVRENTAQEFGGGLRSLFGSTPLLEDTTLCGNVPDQFNGAVTEGPGTCVRASCSADADGDLVPDCEDGCPDDPGKIDPGTCGCGTPDTDTDLDGTLDCLDGCPD